MGSIGAEVFCNILRCKDHIYTSNIAATQGISGSAGGFRLKGNQFDATAATVWSPFAKYYDNVGQSDLYNTAGTAYDYGAEMAGYQVVGRPGITQFHYNVTAGAPIVAAAAATIDFWLKDARPDGGFINQTGDPSIETTLSIGSGTSAGWWEIDVQAFGDPGGNPNLQKLVFTNRGAADYVGYLDVMYSQAPEFYGQF